MGEFEKWADDCDESDEKYYAIPVGSVARNVAKAAWKAGREAGMREAAKVAGLHGGGVITRAIARDIRAAILSAIEGAK